MATGKVGSYQIIPHSKLIIEYYSGGINISDLIQLKREISKDPNHNFYFNTIIDFRDAELEIHKDELRGILDFFRKNFKVSGVRKVAYLTSSPNDVVITSLFTIIANEYSDLQFNLNTFSTLEAANNWLGVSAIEPGTISSIIYELKTTPKNVYEK